MDQYIEWEGGCDQCRPGTSRGPFLTSRGTLYFNMHHFPHPNPHSHDKLSHPTQHIQWEAGCDQCRPGASRGPFLTSRGMVCFLYPLPPNTQQVITPHPTYPMRRRMWPMLDLGLAEDHLSHPEVCYTSAVEIRRTCRTIGHFLWMSDKKCKSVRPNVRQKI